MLFSQSDIQSHFHIAVLNLNQQIALVQEQVDFMLSTRHISYDPFFHAIYVTPVYVINASSSVKYLNQLISGSWNAICYNLTRQLFNKIVLVNNTRVDPIDGSSTLSMFFQVGMLAKEWTGVTSLAGFSLICLMLVFVYLCRLRAQQVQSQAVVRGLVPLHGQEVPST